MEINTRVNNGISSMTPEIYELLVRKGYLTDSEKPKINDDELRILPEFICALIRNRNVAKSEIAKKMNIPCSYVDGMINGNVKRIKRKKLEKLLETLSVSEGNYEDMLVEAFAIISDSSISNVKREQQLNIVVLSRYQITLPNTKKSKGKK